MEHKGVFQKKVWSFPYEAFLVTLGPHFGIGCRSRTNQLGLARIRNQRLLEAFLRTGGTWWPEYPEIALAEHSLMSSIGGLENCPEGGGNKPPLSTWTSLSNAIQMQFSSHISGFDKP